MPHSFAPLKVLLLMFAGWISRHQLEVIEYLQEENRGLRSAWSGGAFTLPMPSVVDLLEKRKHLGGGC